MKSATRADCYTPMPTEIKDWLAGTDYYDDLTFATAYFKRLQKNVIHIEWRQYAQVPEALQRMDDAVASLQANFRLLSDLLLIPSQYRGSLDHRRIRLAPPLEARVRAESQERKYQRLLGPIDDAVGAIYVNHTNCVQAMEQVKDAQSQKNSRSLPLKRNNPAQAIANVDAKCEQIDRTLSQALTALDTLQQHLEDEGLHKEDAPLTVGMREHCIRSLIPQLRETSNVLREAMSELGNSVNHPQKTAAIVNFTERTAQRDKNLSPPR